MTLARKLTLAFVVVMTAVLAASALLALPHEMERMEADVERDHRTLGSGLRPAVNIAWRDEGEARALALVEETNLLTRRDLQIRWVWLDARAEPSHRPATPRVRLGDARHGLLVQLREQRSDADWLYTYVPVRAPDGRQGAIEMGESLANEIAAVHGTVVRTAVTTALIALLSALVTSLLGISLAGRSAQEARAAALDQLRHADRLNTVGKLASGIAHELGTPINVITMEAKRIATGKAGGSAATESAQLIQAQGERMTRIIQQLLDFARRKPMRMGTLDLRDAVAGSAALLRPLADRRKVRVQIDAPEPIAVVADRGRIEQVLTNVLVNGIQASPEGSELRVAVQRAERRRPGDQAPSSWGRIVVADAGPGIAPEVLPHIFEPFFTTKEVGEGTGLGLSVAYGIVDEHGGFIDVESDGGRGARFGIHLPLDTGGR